MIHEIVTPSVGESISEVRIANWKKRDGDLVKPGDVLLEIESDKASVEVVAESSGQLKILETSSDMIPIGKIIGQIDDSVAVVSSGNGATKSPTLTSTPAPATPTRNSEITLSPAVRKMVEEKNINTQEISGSGKAGRLTKGDVLSHIAGETPRAATAASAAPAAPSARPLQAGERRVPMSLLRAKIAERLVQAQHTAAILTTFNEVDLKAVMDLRAKYKDAFKKKYNVGLGFMSFFTKACCIALKEIPEINAYVEGKDILYHDYYHVGVAVGTDRGLVVPVLRNADQLTFAGIEQGILDLAVKARDGKLSIADMSNGTFTISNGGVYGSMLSTPILNAPQSGILGMHNIMQRPVVIDGKIEIRPMMYLALSYDHRVVDGKGAVTFLVRVRECLENPESLGLDFKNEL
jgi:2-oxoglutarate dehydrogenase E2 component (dihydrolipoamide succinyltransferase)